MDGTFACPDCGCGIELGGLSPGRQVRCDWCGGVVEVPFIPRAEEARRLRRDRHRGRKVAWSWRYWPVWARVTTAVLSVALVVALAARLVSSRMKAADAAGLARMVAASVEAEKKGDFGRALVEMEAVVARGGRMTPPPAHMEEYAERRDRIARRDVEAQIARLDAAPASGTDPALAVGQALTLQARASRDPALVGYQPAIEATLNRWRRRWIEADAADSFRAFESGEIRRAMELCERRARTAEALPTAEARTAQAEAAAFASTMIAQHGVLIETVKGRFTLGTPESYEQLLRPIFNDALERRGYLPRPVRPAWPEVWDSRAPYRITFEVDESQEETYLQSPNRLSALRAKVVFSRDTTTLWNDNPLARTSVPLPRLPAYQASRVAVSDRRSPDFERLLYENARANLLERVGHGVRNLPGCPAIPSTALGPS